MRYINIKFLRSFLAVVECRNTARAAHRCGVSPTSIQSHIRSVEKSVGVQLLKRPFPPNAEEVGRTQMTAAGRKFLPKAIKAIRAHDDLFDDAPAKPGIPEVDWAVAADLLDLASDVLRHDLSEDDRQLIYEYLLIRARPAGDDSAG